MRQITARMTTVAALAGLMLATTSVAWAHVVASPKEAHANQYQKFAVSVPTEKDIPTTKIRVEVPEGFTVTGV